MPVRERGGDQPQPRVRAVLSDDSASGRHAHVYRDGGGWFVDDLSSTNGTLLLFVELLVTMRVVTNASSLIAGVALVAVMAIVVGIVFTQRTSSPDPQENFTKPIQIVTLGHPGASPKEIR